MAQDGPSERGYSERLGVIGEIETETPTQDRTPTPTPTPEPPVQQAAPTPVQQEGDLPFTGLDVGIVLVMGAALLGTGLLLRRTTRRGSDTA